MGVLGGLSSRPEHGVLMLAVQKYYREHRSRPRNPDFQSVMVAADDDEIMRGRHPCGLHDRPVQRDLRARSCVGLPDGPVEEGASDPGLRLDAHSGLGS